MTTRTISRVPDDRVPAVEATLRLDGLVFITKSKNSDGTWEITATDQPPRAGPTGASGTAGQRAPSGKT